MRVRLKKCQSFSPFLLPLLSLSNWEFTMLIDIELARYIIVAGRLLS